MNPLRLGVARRMHAVLGGDRVDLSRPDGDPGLFGPGSASWRVHGDVGSMLVGGVAALLTQMLHPKALTGVWDHSAWRRDPVGRLKRTAAFVATCTYGSTARAHEAIARVRRIHDRVRGVLLDGTPYEANDPALLTWVHAAEVDCFLRAHLRFRDPWMAGAEQDRYLAEQAGLARMLGAGDPPDDRARLRDYFARVRPELDADARTREVSRLLLAQPSPSLLTAPMNQLLLRAGVDLLRPWAARMHELRLPPGQGPAVRAGAWAAGGVFRWAIAG
ncbi:MAG TPA: oxygenase MpaB family protein [Geminicoccaceae bacterium]